MCEVCNQAEEGLEGQSILLFDVLYEQLEDCIGMVQQLRDILAQRVRLVQETRECLRQVQFCPLVKRRTEVTLGQVAFIVRGFPPFDSVHRVDFQPGYPSRERFVSVQVRRLGRSL